jgi:hypothetical protein
VVLSDPLWRYAPLDNLVAEIGRMHAWSVDGRVLGDQASGLTRAGAAADLALWQGDLVKLAAAAHLPGGAEWLAFWSPREPHYKAILDELSSFPTTWIWGDAKWDHLGRRGDGTIVVLEWSSTLGPAGSDLYLCLFEPPARQVELKRIYRDHAGGLVGGQGGLTRYLDLGLMRACYVHGVGQACLSLRGCAGGADTPADRVAWTADANTTAQSLTALAD